MPVKWSRGDFFTLGIWFNSEDENNVINKNLKTKLEDLKVTLNLWKMRNLSLLGKILVTKSLALSKLVYVASVIPIPDNIINLVQKEINRFIWNSEIPKIKYTISCQRFGDGGFKFPNFEIQVKSLQLNWIKRFFSANEAKWKKLINAFTGTMNITDLLLTRCSLSTSTIKLPTFYDNVITSWKILRNCMNEISLNPPILTECLWFNNYICIENKPIFFSEWYKNGIMFLEDILNNNGTFLTLDEFYERFRFKPSFLQYTSLLSSIPSNWKKTAKKETHFLSNEKDQNYTLNIQGKLVPLCNLTCKDIYWILLNSCKDSTPCIQKWSEI